MSIALACVEGRRDRRREPNGDVILTRDHLADQPSGVHPPTDLVVLVREIERQVVAMVRDWNDPAALRCRLTELEGL